MSRESELTLIAHERKVNELFGDYNTLELHTLPIETLEAMKNHYVVLLSRFSEEKSSKYAVWNEAKTALRVLINEKKIAHLADLTGSDKARIATMYAEQDCKTEIQGVTILENEYKEISNRHGAYETVIRSLMQTISTVNKEAAFQQFVKGN